MRRLCACVLIALTAAVSTAAPPTDRERQAAAAIALAHATPRAAAGEKCTCPAGTRGDWPNQLAKALKEKRAVVLFAGGAEPRCCQGMLVGSTKQLPAGVDPHKPIVVYVPAGEGMFRVSAELPADVPLPQLRAAVKKAKEGDPKQPK